MVGAGAAETVPVLPDVSVVPVEAVVPEVPEFVTVVSVGDGADAGAGAVISVVPVVPVLVLPLVLVLPDEVVPLLVLPEVEPEGAVTGASTVTVRVVWAVAPLLSVTLYERTYVPAVFVSTVPATVMLLVRSVPSAALAIAPGSTQLAPCASCTLASPFSVIVMPLTVAS